MNALHFVVPGGIDDPDRPSGGNAYDRRVCPELEALGWSVYEHAAPGGWPRPEPAAVCALADIVQLLPDGALVLIDGLVASAVPEVLVPMARRLRLVVLVHMPIGHRPPPHAAGEIRNRERAVLQAAAAVITTSQWSRSRLLHLYPLAPEAVHVAEPGVECAPLANGTIDGGELLCVAAVTFEKGHDVLVDALLSMRECSWECRCVGSFDRDPAFAQGLLQQSVEGGLDGRVSFLGPRVAFDLDRSYAAADLVVLPSRAETYGMVITEALARGLPVLATEVGGVTEALGCCADGTRPGLLVAPDDPAALAAALRAWLDDAELRGRLRQAARERRDSLCGWSTTASLLASVLPEVRP